MSLALGIIGQLGITITVVHALPIPLQAGAVRDGVTPWEVMSAQGVFKQDILQLKRTLLSRFGHHRFREGAAFRYGRDRTGALEVFVHQCGELRYSAQRTGDRFSWSAKRIAPQSRSVLIEGVIEGGLRATVERMGERPELAWLIAELFGGDANLWQKARAGDRFDLLIEKRLIDGVTIGYGRLSVARYRVHSGATYFAFGLWRADGSYGYYTETGSPIGPRFMAWPTRSALITSGFGARRHPIHGRLRPHHGVDLGIADGARIVAAHQGTVTHAEHHQSLGNLVIICDRNGLQTRYAHLSGFAPGLIQGKRVRRGQTIGFAGSTGLTTGVHLHFETSLSGAPLDPESIILPWARPLSDDERARFEEVVLKTWERLETMRHRLNSTGHAAGYSSRAGGLDLATLFSADTLRITKQRLPWRAC